MTVIENGNLPSFSNFPIENVMVKKQKMQNWIWHMLFWIECILFLIFICRNNLLSNKNNCLIHIKTRIK